MSIVVLPERDDDQISRLMRILTRVLSGIDPEGLSLGFLGGRWGYGCEFHNSTFRMQPYYDVCTCGSETGPHSKDCVLVIPQFQHFPSGAKVEWYKWIGRSMKVYQPYPEFDWRKCVQECIASARKGRV